MFQEFTVHITPSYSSDTQVLLKKLALHAPADILLRDSDDYQLSFWAGRRNQQLAAAASWLRCEVPRPLHLLHCGKGQGVHSVPHSPSTSAIDEHPQ